MILEILQHPDPRLQKTCDKVVDALPETLIADMFETMYAAPGRGLAAPQVGEMQRVFVMDTSWKDGDMTPLAFINPTVVERSEQQQINSEACLSILGQERSVARPNWVVLAWQGIDGKNSQKRFEGFDAACVLHELDHLDGKLILDHPEAL